MNIAAGMATLKTAFDLTRSLRDGLKAGQIKGDEVAGRIGEIYDYIGDSKDALSEAKDEIQILKQKVSELETELNRRLSMKFAYGAYSRGWPVLPTLLGCAKQTNSAIRNTSRPW